MVMIGSVDIPWRNSPTHFVELDGQEPGMSSTWNFLEIIILSMMSMNEALISLCAFMGNILASLSCNYTRTINRTLYLCRKHHSRRSRHTRWLCKKEALSPSPAPPICLSLFLSPSLSLLISHCSLPDSSHSTSLPILRFNSNCVPSAKKENSYLTGAGLSDQGGK